MEASVEAGLSEGHLVPLGHLFQKRLGLAVLTIGYQQSATERRSAKLCKLTFCFLYSLVGCSVLAT
jgi:hypothetical protein